MKDTICKTIRLAHISDSMQEKLAVHDKCELYNCLSFEVHLLRYIWQSWSKYFFWLRIQDPYAIYLASPKISRSPLYNYAGAFTDTKSFANFQFHYNDFKMHQKSRE